MGEGALKWGFRLLGIFFAIGPFLIALGIHNWDIQAAVLPSEAEMSKAKDMLSEIVGGDGVSVENMFALGTPTLVGTTIEFPTEFASPFKIPVKITEVSASITGDNGKIADVQMKEGKVEASAQENTTITLVGTPTGATLTNPQFENVGVKFEVYGVTVTVQFTQAQGGSR